LNDYEEKSMNAQKQPVHDSVTLSDDERQPCELWTRVMGYHRPVGSFNIGKKGEHHKREFFKEACADLA
jgi:anaerobic ribonucleoside-triphosphate reductase